MISSNTAVMMFSSNTSVMIESDEQRNYLEVSDLVVRVNDDLMWVSQEEKYGYTKI